MLALFTILFSARLGVVGFAVDALEPAVKAQVINGLACAALAYIARIWVAMWLGWRDASTEFTVAMVIMFNAGFIGMATTSCEVFVACPTPLHPSDCESVPNNRGIEVQC